MNIHSAKYAFLPAPTLQFLLVLTVVFLVASSIGWMISQIINRVIDVLEDRFK